MVARIDNIRSTSGLLQNTDLELTATSEVYASRAGNASKLCCAGRVVDGSLAVMVSVCYIRSIRRSSLAAYDLLLGVIKLNSKVLPLLVIDRNTPDLFAGTVKDLEVVLLGVGVTDQSANLELDLVVAVVCRLVPHIEVLMGQVQRSIGILLDGEVQCLHALVAGILRGVGCELQSCATKSVLLLENGLVGDGDFDGRVGCAVEAAWLSGWKLEDLRPGQVVALDVVWVEEGVGSVEDGGRLGEVCRNAAIEDDRTFHILRRSTQ